MLITIIILLLYRRLISVEKSESSVFPGNAFMLVYHNANIDTSPLDAAAKVFAVVSCATHDNALALY